MIQESQRIPDDLSLWVKLESSSFNASQRSRTAMTYVFRNLYMRHRQSRRAILFMPWQLRSTTFARIVAAMRMQQQPAFSVYASSRRVALLPDFIFLTSNANPICGGRISRLASWAAMLLFASCLRHCCLIRNEWISENRIEGELSSCYMAKACMSTLIRLSSIEEAFSFTLRNISFV